MIGRWTGNTATVFVKPKTPPSSVSDAEDAAEDEDRHQEAVKQYVEDDLQVFDLSGSYLRCLCFKTECYTRARDRTCESFLSARCTLVQSAVLRSHVVCLSVRL